MNAVRIGPDLRMAVVWVSSYSQRAPLPGHNCINLRLPTRGGSYPWKFETGRRRLNVDGKLVFIATAQMLNAALAGFGLAYVPEDLVQSHIVKNRLASLGRLVPAIFRLPFLLPKPSPNRPPRSRCSLRRSGTDNPEESVSRRTATRVSSQTPLVGVRNLVRHAFGLYRTPQCTVWRLPVGLHSQLTRLRHDCVALAFSKIPKMVNEDVKNDRRDGPVLTGQ